MAAWVNNQLTRTGLKVSVRCVCIYHSDIEWAIGSGVCKSLIRGNIEVLGYHIAVALSYDNLNVCIPIPIVSLGHDERHLCFNKLCHICLLLFLFICFHFSVSTTEKIFYRLTSRVQARGADYDLRDSGTGDVIPRCLQRMVWLGHLSTSVGNHFDDIDSRIAALPELGLFDNRCFLDVRIKGGAGAGTAERRRPVAPIFAVLLSEFVLAAVVGERGSCSRRRNVCF